MKIDSIQENNRDYLFDNMRAILVIIVVWGHLLTSMIYDYESIKTIYCFLYFFHMPALTFISGYFSKNINKARDTAFEYLLIPYLILNVCNYIFKILIMKEQFSGFNFLRPLWGLWYLLALFLWKFLLKDLIKIRFILPFSFIFSILSGFSKEFSSHLTLGRVFSFLPFFLVGYYCSEKCIEKIRKTPKIVGLIISAGVGLLSVLIVRYNILEVGDLYFRKAYPKDSGAQHMFYRIMIYIVALLMIVALIILISNKKNFLSTIGQNTMTVYILHLFTIPLLEKLKLLYERPYLYTIYSILMTAIISYLYSRPIVSRIFNKLMNGIVSLIMVKNKEKY